MAPPRAILTLLGVSALVLVMAAIVMKPADLNAIQQVSEAWLTGHPEWGIMVFIVVSTISMVVMIPEVIFGLAAGALFGFVWGSISLCISGLLCSLAAFYIARQYFQGPVQKVLADYPKLQAIEAVINRGELRLLCLLRLLPVNPAMMSYVLATTNVKFLPYSLASCCMIPAWILTVYVGSLATNVASVVSGASDFAPMRDSLTVVGLIFSIAVMVYITRLAARQCTHGAEVEE